MDWQPSRIPVPSQATPLSSRRVSNPSSRLVSRSEIRSISTSVGGKQTIVIGEVDVLPYNPEPQVSEQPTQIPQNTWSSYVFNFVGDIAGKAWQFARDSAFRGFQAGGGDAYQLTDSAPKRLLRRLSDPWTSRLNRMPGQFPSGEEDRIYQDKDESLDDFADSELDEQRPAKRKQINKGSQDWVFVTRTQSQRATSTSQASTPPNYSLPNTSASRVSSAPRLSHRRSRPSVARLSTPSNNGVSSRTRVPSPLQPYARDSIRASEASTRLTPQQQKLNPDRHPFETPGKIDMDENTPLPSSQRKRAAQTNSSPVSADVQRYTAKRRREERKADESMKKLDQQMKEMIKQGREALASKIEIEDENDYDFYDDYDE